MMFLASLKASKTMFEKLSYTVLRTPLRWLDQTPVGRILNRFTADFNTLDSSLAPDMAFTIYQGLELICVTVVAFFVSMYMVPMAFLLSALAGYLGFRYLEGARETKRY